MRPPVSPDSPIIEEYTLDTREGKTVLRLVHSGIPTTSDWDGFYDGTDRGWDMFFRGLRHYLEKHPGKSRHNITIMQPVNESMEDAWEKLTGPAGLAATGSFSGLNEGSRYSVETSHGEKLEGAAEFKAVEVIHTRVK